VDNYDGTEKEPEILTCVIPNLLANGSNGIAVGMATNIPTHNLRELTAAVKLVISNPDVSTAELMEVIPGPDFPTGAEIIGIEGIANYFETGRGSVKIRAKTEIIEREGIHTIVVTEIPYMVAKGALIDKIIELVRDKKIEGISDIQDFSSNEGTRLEIKLKRNIIPEVLLNQLYKNTQLQTSFAVNMLAMVKGEPKVLNLKEALLIYVEHQIECLVNKTIFDKKKAEARKHILEGLHIALDDIDKVISIIRGSTDNDAAVAELMSYFKIDEIQAKAITEMKLRALSGLERQKIEDELKALTLLVEDLADILNNKSRQYTIVVEKLEAVAKKIGDERRSVIRTDISCDINNEDLIPKEDILITMSSKG
jgi:DNA gyrase subunit A